MRTVWLILPLWFVSKIGFAQSIASGTINGSVVDQSGAVIAGATVSLRSVGTNYEQSVTTDETGAFHLANIPLSPYRLTITAPGFNDAAQQVEVRSTIPIALPNIALTLGTNVTSVAVQANAPLVELDPSAHTNCDDATLSKLPEFGPAVGLTTAIRHDRRELGLVRHLRRERHSWFWKGEPRKFRCHQWHSQRPLSGHP
jgi:hypothetical protein